MSSRWVPPGCPLWPRRPLGRRSGWWERNCCIPPGPCSMAALPSASEMAAPPPRQHVADTGSVLALPKGVAGRPELWGGRRWDRGLAHGVLWRAGDGAYENGEG